METVRLLVIAVRLLKTDAQDRVCQRADWIPDALFPPIGVACFGENGIPGCEVGSTTKPTHPPKVLAEYFRAARRVCNESKPENDVPIR